MNILRTLAFVLLASVLSGCGGNGFKTSFTSLLRGETVLPTKKATLIPYGGLVATADGNRTFAGRPENTRLIGYSAFSSGMGEGKGHALSAAKSVGADFVMFEKEFASSHVIQGSMTVPDIQTSYSNGSVYGNTYGSYGSSNFTGSYMGSTTTYGTRSMPYAYTIIRYNYVAAFFRSLSLDD